MSTAIASAPPVGKQDGDLIALINERRSEVGCGQVAGDGALSGAAQRHADDMRDNGVRSHTGSDGSTPGDRVNQSGFAATATGEIIYWGTGVGAHDAVAAWMDSPGHRDIIADCEFNYVGAASSGGNGEYFAVAVFASA